MENNETLNKLAGFIDGLVAEQVAKANDEKPLEEVAKALAEDIKAGRAEDYTSEQKEEFLKLAETIKTMFSDEEAEEDDDRDMADKLNDLKAEDCIAFEDALNDMDYVEKGDIDEDWVYDNLDDSEIENISNRYIGDLPSYELKDKIINLIDQHL